MHACICLYLLLVITVLTKIFSSMKRCADTPMGPRERGKKSNSAPNMSRAWAPLCDRATAMAQQQEKASPRQRHAPAHAGLRLLLPSFTALPAAFGTQQQRQQQQQQQQRRHGEASDELNVMLGGLRLERDSQLAIGDGDPT
jgi:hypothetical protein